MLTNRKRIVLAIGCALLMALAAGAVLLNDPTDEPVSAQGGPASSPTPPHPVPEVVAPPLAVITNPDIEQRRTIQDGLDTLTAVCMDEAGFDFVPFPFEAPHTQTRYGLVDEAQAAQHGYRSTDPAPAGEQAYLPSDAYTFALVGNQEEPEGHVIQVRSPSGAVLAEVFRDGCMWEAEQEIYGDWATLEATRLILQRVASEAFAQVEGSETLTAAVDDWSECMDGQGYDVASVDEIHDELLPELRGHRDSAESIAASEAEKALAVADAWCNNEVGLATTWAAADAEAQSSLLPLAEVTPEQYQSMIDEAETRAQAVLER